MKQHTHMKRGHMRGRGRGRRNIEPPEVSREELSAWVASDR